jgi:hypothetical protein
MNINRVTVRAVGAGVLVAGVVGAMPSTAPAGISRAQAATTSSTYAHHAHHHVAAVTQVVETSETGNKIELVDPAQSSYIPNLQAAPARQRDRARGLLRGVNRFCRTHTVAELKAGWRPGTARDSDPTHYFNPERGASGVNPANPRAALVYDGEVGGVMFTGQPLPRLGVIPRAHRHGQGSSMGTDSHVEMVHVYCSEDLTRKSVREAYTPNRLLGVLADTIRLRLRIRPAIMDLSPRQLREVRDRVRRYVGEQATQSTGIRMTSATGPDPRLQAMRTEIREGLMQLDEAQLRSIWRLMRSYR